MVSVDQQYVIDRGDSKDKLFAQIQDIGRYTGNDRRGFGLKVNISKNELPKQIYVLVNGIRAEDGSGNCWLINGYIAGELLSFEGYYNTNTRKGWIRFK